MRPPGLRDGDALGERDGCVADARHGVASFCAHQMLQTSSPPTPALRAARSVIMPWQVRHDDDAEAVADLGDLGRVARSGAGPGDDTRSSPSMAGAARRASVSLICDARPGGPSCLPA